MELQLASTTDLMVLLAATAEQPKTRRSHSNRDLTADAAARHRHQPCPPDRQCRECAENARWEQIYREKFADPDYYSGARIETSSCLADVPFVVV